MKFLPHAALSILTLFEASAQIPEQATPTVSIIPAGFNLDWYGHGSRTYFVEYSADLINWAYMPVIESGVDAALGYGFSTHGDKLFLRVRYTDIPTSDPNSADFDGDGVSNWDEVRIGGTATNPFKWDTDGDGESDYFADHDDNGVSDGWEIKHFAGIGIVEPLGDEDGDGRNNSEESQLDTDPDAHADTNDEDGDGLVDAEDTVPDDPLINWPSESPPVYVYTELPALSGMEEITGVAIGEAGHILVKAWPVGVTRNVVNMQNFVWQPSTGLWSGPLSKVYNGSTGESLSAESISSTGEIAGSAWVVDLDNQGDPEHAYMATCVWSSATASPQPTAGTRLAQTGEYPGYAQYAYVLSPRYAPDNKLLSMSHGLIEFGVSPAAKVKLNGDDLADWWDPYEIYPNYSAKNYFGYPGAGAIVPMTKKEVYFNESSEELDDRTVATYFYENGSSQTIASGEKAGELSASSFMPDQNGDSGQGFAAVTGSSTWLRKNGVWAKTKRHVAGRRITSSGLILTPEYDITKDLWKEGKYYTIEELSPAVTEQGYTNFYPVEMNDGGSILIQAEDQNGEKKVGVAMPIILKEFEPNSGFDNFERLHNENKLTRPWLTIPETNKVLMLRNPAVQKLNLTVDLPAGKDGTVDPVESSQSPETLTISSNGPWGANQVGYEGVLKVNNADALNLAVYKKRTIEVAVHAITLINDDDDTTGIKYKEGKPNTVCVRKQGTVMATTPGGDDVPEIGYIHTGPNGICETTANGDEQVIPLGNGEPNAVFVQPGANGVLNTVVNDSGNSGASLKDPNNDDEVVGQSITTGANGIRDTLKVRPQLAPLNVPTAVELKTNLDLVFGKQANIFFDVISYNAIGLAYDSSDPSLPITLDDHPNYFFDFKTGGDLTPEESLLDAAAFNAAAKINIYYLPTQIRWLKYIDSKNLTVGSEPFGYAPRFNEALPKRVYIAANKPDCPAKYLSGVAAHEIGHHILFANSLSLDHPRYKVDSNYKPTEKSNCPLKKIEDDKKRLMFPQSQEGQADFPSLLLKEECDKLNGVWEGDDE